jgi:hypothetical protein
LAKAPLAMPAMADVRKTRLEMRCLMAAT